MKLIRKHNELNLLKESDDFDWIKDIDISDYLEPPYLINMEKYGLSKKEYESTLSKVFNQPVKIIGDSIYGNKGKLIYSENSNGYWEKWEYDANGNQTYFEDELGYWEKWEYDGQGNLTYTEDSNGYWSKYGYDELGNEIYYENSDGDMVDNRNLNESDDMDWIKDVDIVNHIEIPYFKSMEEYGLRPDDYEITLSKVFNQPVTIEGRYVYDEPGNKIYLERSEGSWVKWEYDNQGNEIHYEDSYGTIIDNR